MTEIERMWENAQKDESHKRMNGSLLTQAKYICSGCGTEFVGNTTIRESCPKCGALESLDA